MAFQAFQAEDFKKVERNLYHIIEAHRKNPGTVRGITLVRACRLLGETLGRQNRLTEARTAFQFAMPVAEALISEGAEDAPSMQASVTESVGRALVAEGQAEKGRELLMEAMGMFESQEGGTRGAESTRLMVADSYVEEGDVEGALTFLRAKSAELLAKGKEIGESAKETEKEGGENDEDGGSEGQSNVVKSRVLRHGGVALMAKESAILAGADRTDEAIEAARKGLAEVRGWVERKGLAEVGRWAEG